MEEMKRKAKKKMLQALRKQMAESGGESMIGEGLGVTVKAKDEEGLKEGLEKASELVDEGVVEEMEKKADDEMMEEHEEEDSMTQDEIKEQIADLESMLE